MELIQHVFTEGEKTKVLSVDDEFDVSYSLKRCLEETGLFQVNDFADATEALTHFRPRIYDLVILDNKKPGMDDFQLYQKLKALDNNIQVWFLTAAQDLSDYKKLYPDIVEAIEKNEIKCFMDKPVGSEQLIKMVNRAL
jgi:DNA-binding NtrC family response regulator